MVSSPSDVQLLPLTRVLEVLLSKHGKAPLSNQQTELVQAFAGQVGELDPLYFGAELGSDRTMLGVLQQIGERGIGPVPDIFMVERIEADLSAKPSRIMKASTHIGSLSPLS